MHILCASRLMFVGHDLQAASLKIAEQYVGAFGNIAKEWTTILLPSATGNPANTMALAFTMYNNMLSNVSGGGPDESSSLMEAKDESARDNGETGFSLQSRQKGKTE
ncbi:hypothetical protein OIU77_001083 [Salix suchowensis]|uniref:STML2-like C-terminal extension domain-containing protein n=1 Tax=Salix suchowensis TaxID=1278906 RepID=A0ABQ9BAD5_9ROSI|nr:hypothetical protein OIU77_001083 [Salix suchowensis]